MFENTPLSPLPFSKLTVARTPFFDAESIGLSSLFLLQNIPHLDPEAFQPISVEVNGEILHLKGSFENLFSYPRLEMDAYLYDVGDEQKRRHLIARFSTPEGNLAALRILASLAGFEGTAPPLAFGSNDQAGSLQFMAGSMPAFWFSSGDPAPPLEILTALGHPDPLPTGITWPIDLDFQAGKQLTQWLPASLRPSGVLLNLFPDGHQPIFTVELDYDTPITIGDPNSLALEFKAFWISFSGSEEGLKLQSIGLKGMIDLPKATQLDFKAELNLQHWQLYVQLSRFPSLKEFFGKFFSESGDDPLISRVHPEGDMSPRLRFVDFFIDLKPLRLSAIAFQVDTPDSIAIPELLNVSFKPTLDVQVRNPFTAQQQVDFQLSGWMELAGGRFNIHYTHLERRLMLRMGNGSQLSSSSLIREMGLPFQGDWNLSILDIDFFAQKRDTGWAMRGMLHISSNLHFELLGTDFHFRELLANFEYNAHALQELRLRGFFGIGNLDIEAEARYVKEKGFFFRGQLAAHESLTIEQVVEQAKLTENIPAQEGKFKEGITDLAGGGIHIDRLSIDAFFPTKDAPEGTSKEFSLLLQLGMDPDTLPIPLDSAFIKLGWKGSIQWQAVLHFRLGKAQQDDEGNWHPGTELFLESSYDYGNLILKGGIQEFHMADLLVFLEDRFKVTPTLPPALRDLGIRTLDLEVRKQNGHWGLVFDAEVFFPFEEGVQDKGLDLRLRFQVGKKAEGWDIIFSAAAKVDLEQGDSLEFALIFDHSSHGDWIAFQFGGIPEPVSLKALLSQWLPEMEALPEMKIDLNEAYVLWDRSDEAAPSGGANETDKRKSKFLLGLHLSASISLKDSELLRNYLDEDQSVGLENLRLAFATGDWKRTQLETIAGQLAAIINTTDTPHNLPIPGVSGQEEPLTKGFHVSGKFVLGSLFSKEFSTEKPVSPDEEGHGDENDKADANLQQSSNKIVLSKEEDNGPGNALTKWFKVNKDLGPFHLGRLGVELDLNSGSLWILLDAGLQIAVLSVAVDGLGVGSPLDHFEPRFKLNGISADLKRGQLELGAALINIPQKEEGALRLDGAAILRFGELGLSAIGSYESKPEHPASFFLYAELDAPIGGPPFFFVEGLSAGFGVHRKIEFPAIENLSSFPLLSNAHAAAAGNKASDLMDRVSAIRDFLPVSEGHYFLAAGIQFSTFKLLHTQILLIIGWGNALEIDLLGKSQLTIPPPELGSTIAPVASAVLLLHAAFRPAAGTLKVDARLDPAQSYLLSKDVKLQGGFAFYTWFLRPDGSQPEEANAGEFILTLGGYHPRFKRPTFYPSVPALGIRWTLGKSLNLKGDLYFALSPSTLMFGGSLSLTFTLGSFQAGLDLSMDFLIAWKPFHYEGDFNLHIWVDYKNGILQFHGELSAEAHVWGPDFGGHLRFKVLALVIEAEFGARQKTRRQRLNWQAFRSSFLPKDDSLFALNASGGLLDTSAEETKNLGHFDPGTLQIDLDFPLPVSSLKIQGVGQDIHPDLNVNWGILPMQQNRPDTSVQIEIYRIEGSLGVPADTVFRFETRTNNLPHALWGLYDSRAKSEEAKANQPALLENLWTGVRLQPKRHGQAPEGGNVIFQPPELLIEEQKVMARIHEAPSSEWLDPNQDLDSWFHSPDPELLDLYGQVTASDSENRKAPQLFIHPNP